MNYSVQLAPNRIFAKTLQKSDYNHRLGGFICEKPTEVCFLGHEMWVKDCGKASKGKKCFSTNKSRY